MEKSKHEACKICILFLSGSLYFSAHLRYTSGLCFTFENKLITNNHRLMVKKTFSMNNITKLKIYPRIIISSNSGKTSSISTGL